MKDSMSKIECLWCYKKLDIPEWIDTNNYDGEIICKECGARLAMKFVNSQLKKYKLRKEGKIEIKVEYEDVDKTKLRNID